MSFHDNLIQILLNEPYAKFNTNKTEIMMRCPFCGDSVKHAYSTHLYIKVDNDGDSPYPYYCQRCTTTGIIDKDFFKALKIKDTDLLISVIDFNKKATKNKKKYSKSMQKTLIRLPETYKNTRRNHMKLAYINQRIGTDLTLDDLYKYKIVLNLYDLLDKNNVDFLTCSDKVGDTLHDNFIGFLSFDNNYMIMRNLSTKIMKEMRYYNYNIFNSYENSKRFYVIPTPLDLTDPSVTIVLAEGVFDILSVYFNIKDQCTDNYIYAAVGGVGYIDVIKQLVRYTGCINFNLEIYGDNDQSIKFYKEIINKIPHLVNRFTLYQNSLEKDFGVPLDRIRISKKIVK